MELVTMYRGHHWERLHYPLLLIVNYGFSAIFEALIKLGYCTGNNWSATICSTY